MSTQEQAASSTTSQSEGCNDAGYLAWRTQLEAGRLYEKGASLREVGEFLGTGRAGAFLTLSRLGLIGDCITSRIAEDAQ
ncbi:hypothetical protein [Noviherbaspirillum pedocola]|uniref:Uncharacterized protein n=1 Tax=Noviherbaspirillum pedocola TaxID=2801341 RepID=A0A934SVK9_9BURK|nr:hypothetical protein [Noviherbaspirillum pedocola]MBK4736220.1 hypothetical protein [Noviherbaspirillum pedocola]